MRGRCPKRLILESPDEIAYIKAMVKAGVLLHGRALFCSRHFFLRTQDKLRLIFDGRKLNDAVKKPPRFNMKSHKTIRDYCQNDGWTCGADLKNMYFSVHLAK